MEFNKRRRIFYIDKIFQKKLMVLFLGLNVVIVAANIIYYFSYLKGSVEDNLYRSHIVLSNVSEVMAGEIIRFNILLAVVSFALVLVLYTVTRLRLKSFFGKIKKALESRQARIKKESYSFDIPEEFQEIDRVLDSFFEKTDQELAEENKQVTALKAHIKV
jgi:Flp pilus assembly pilin Flp